MPRTTKVELPARRTCATTRVPASPVVVPVTVMRPVRRPVPARPTIRIDAAARVVLPPVEVPPSALAAPESDGVGVGAAVAVKVAEVAAGVVTRL